MKSMIQIFDFGRIWINAQLAIWIADFGMLSNLSTDLKLEETFYVIDLFLRKKKVRICSPFNLTAA